VRIRTWSSTATLTSSSTARSFDVPADPELRVHDEADLQVVPVQPHGDGVDQERHVVGDDVHDGPVGVEGRMVVGGNPLVAAGLEREPHADQGAALWPVAAEPGVLDRHRGGPGRADGDQVLRRDVPVVGVQITERVADAGDVVAQQRGGRLGRLGQEGLLVLAGIPPNGMLIRVLYDRSHSQLPAFLAEKITSPECPGLL
jgi:hypothetical protein